MKPIRTRFLLGGVFVQAMTEAGASVMRNNRDHELKGTWARSWYQKPYSRTARSVQCGIVMSGRAATSLERAVSTRRRSFEGRSHDCGCPARPASRRPSMRGCDCRKFAKLPYNRDIGRVTAVIKEVLAVTGFEGVEIGRAHRMVLSRCPTCFNSIRALILSVAQWTWLLDSVTQRAATDL